MKDRVVAWVRARPDAFIGLAIAIAYVVWLLATARNLGFARDEGFYFNAAGDYEKWFKMLFDSPRHALDRTAVDAIWQENHEHPSLMKSLFVLSHMLFYEKLAWFKDPSTSWRFPGMCMMGVALWVTYMFATRAYSRRAGIVAALALGLMPNVFYNAHLACFDIPVMAMWVACIYVFWRAETVGGAAMIIFAGVMYGLTLETKHNAWFMPAVLVPYAFIAHGARMSRVASKTGQVPIPATLVSMATIGPLLFILLWPWLWPIQKVGNETQIDWQITLNRIQEYVNFHVKHDYYNIEFLGVTYWGPPSPRSYMPVMIAATVPTTTLLLFAVGAIDRARFMLMRASGVVSSWIGKKIPWPKTPPPKDKLHTDVLVFLGIIVAVGPWLLPRTPIFGGTKHWMTAYPFLAMLAGRGFDICWTRIEELVSKRWKLEGQRAIAAQALAVTAAFSGAFAVTVHSHPFGLSAYVPFAGGTAGGADLGLNRQFWGFTTQSLAPWLEKNAKPNESFYFMDTAWSSWVRMIEEKRLPLLRGVGSPAEAELSIVHHEQHMNEVDYNIWTEYGTSTPAYVLTHDGVPIITVYRRPHPPKSITSSR
jgi:4-amino-4-deoxy-L-arabinose transferase-like glycosyltransferase